LQDFIQIKTDLGKFSDDPDKYIENITKVSQVFDLTWKDIMLILNNASEREDALRAANECGERLYGMGRSGPPGHRRGNLYL
jgi:hypothetical protein